MNPRSDGPRKVGRGVGGERKGGYQSTKYGTKKIINVPNQRIGSCSRFGCCRIFVGEFACVWDKPRTNEVGTRDAEEEGGGVSGERRRGIDIHIRNRKNSNLPKATSRTAPRQPPAGRTVRGRFLGRS